MIAYIVACRELVTGRCRSRLWQPVPHTISKQAHVLHGAAHRERWHCTKVSVGCGYLPNELQLHMYNYSSIFQTLPLAFLDRVDTVQSIYLLLVFESFCDLRGRVACGLTDVSDSMPGRVNDSICIVWDLDVRGTVVVFDILNTNAIVITLGSEALMLPNMYLFIVWLRNVDEN